MPNENSSIAAIQLKQRTYRELKRNDEEIIHNKHQKNNFHNPLNNDKNMYVTQSYILKVSSDFKKCTPHKK